MVIRNEDRAMPRMRMAFLSVLAIGISLLFLWMIGDFVLALVLAAILASLVHPVYRRLLKRLSGRKNAAATLTVLLTIAMVIVPVFIFLGVFLHEAVQVSGSLEPWIAEHALTPDDLGKALNKEPMFQRLVPYQDQIVEKAGQFAGKAASFLAQQVGAATKGTAKFFLLLFIALYAMFYFLKYGRSSIDQVFAFTPLSGEDKQRLVSTFASVAKATLKGTLVIGIVQGTLAGAAFAVAGINSAVFWGAIMAVLSIIPGIGAALVWVPAVAYLALTGKIAAAVGVAVWCAVVVGTADNVLRPLLVGKDTEMPDLLVLLTTLGGLILFGAAGIVIGPIIGALFITVWELWSGASEDVLPPT
jgi:predicted PurR-regulated permease PerM